MMRVLHVISGLDPRAGGPAAAVAGLASAQLREGLDVRVISTWRGSSAPPDDALRKRIAAPVTLVGPARGKLQRHPDLKRQVDRAVADADIVHVHALWEDIQHQAARAARRRRVPYIFRPCGMLDPWSLAQSQWTKKLYLAWRLRADLNGAATLHYTAARARDLAAPLALRPPTLIEPNGVSLDEFDPLPPAGSFRQRYPQVDQRRVVLFLSRLHRKKGLELLLAAFAGAEVGNAMLIVAGPAEADYLDSIRRIVRRHKLDDRVLFTGMLYGAERIAALADADLFVLPSHQENFGIAVIEALAAGTPVIVSDQVNIYQEIVDAGVGEAVPLDGAKLAAALSRWLGDSALREAASKRARPFVRARYDWHQIARRWVKHYARLTGAAPGHI
jgi:glycosyltransferase involved in cell wall biosynthesis